MKPYVPAEYHAQVLKTKAKLPPKTPAITARPSFFGSRTLLGVSTASKEQEKSPAVSEVSEKVVDAPAAATPPPAAKPLVAFKSSLGGLVLPVRSRSSPGRRRSAEVAASVPASNVPAVTGLRTKPASATEQVSSPLMQVTELSTASNSSQESLAIKPVLSRRRSEGEIQGRAAPVLLLDDHPVASPSAIDVEEPRFLAPPLNIHEGSMPSGVQRGRTNMAEPNLLERGRKSRLPAGSSSPVPSVASSSSIPPGAGNRGRSFKLGSPASFTSSLRLPSAPGTPAPIQPSGLRDSIDEHREE